jgi:hypothetical protein
VSIDTSGFEDLKKMAQKAKRKGATGVQLKDLFFPQYYEPV